MEDFNIELKFENEVHSFYSFNDFAIYLEEVHGIDYIVLINDSDDDVVKKDNELYKLGYKAGKEAGYDKGFEAGYNSANAYDYSDGDDYSW